MCIKRFATVSWTIHDVMSLFDISEEEAEKFLQKHERVIQDMLVQRGWDVLEEIGRSVDLPLHDEWEPHVQTNSSDN